MIDYEIILFAFILSIGSIIYMFSIEKIMREEKKILENALLYIHAKMEITDSIPGEE